MSVPNNFNNEISIHQDKIVIRSIINTQNDQDDDNFSSARRDMNMRVNSEENVYGKDAFDNERINKIEEEVHKINQTDDTKNNTKFDMTKEDFHKDNDAIFEEASEKQNKHTQDDSSKALIQNVESSKGMDSNINMKSNESQNIMDFKKKSLADSERVRADSKMDNNSKLPSSRTNKQQQSSINNSNQVSNRYSQEDNADLRGGENFTLMSHANQSPDKIGDKRNN